MIDFVLGIAGQVISTLITEKVTEKPGAATADEIEAIANHLMASQQVREQDSLRIMTAILAETRLLAERFSNSVPEEIQWETGDERAVQSSSEAVERRLERFRFLIADRRLEIANQQSNTAPPQTPSSNGNVLSSAPDRDFLNSHGPTAEPATTHRRIGQLREEIARIRTGLPVI